MAEATRYHHLYINELQRHLANRGVCWRLEFAGSAYEGVKVRRNDKDSDIEFDIMIILQCPSDLQVYLV